VAKAATYETLSEGDKALLAADALREKEYELSDGVARLAAIEGLSADDDEQRQRGQESNHYKLSVALDALPAQIEKLRAAVSAQQKKADSEAEKLRKEAEKDE
jgi:hypothetical protein